MGLIARLSRGLGKKSKDTPGSAEHSAGPAVADPGHPNRAAHANRAGFAERKPSRPASAQAADQAASLRDAVASDDHDSAPDPDAQRHATAPEAATAVDVLDDESETLDDDASTSANARQQPGRLSLNDRDAGARIAAPQTKKELFEELQRNYREVVMLVRKVDAHLDEQAHRSERLMAVAERFDQSLPLLETIAQTPAKLDGIREELAAIAASSGQAADQRAERLESAIAKVVDGVEAQHKDQHQLVSVMAEFRESLGDMNKTNADSSQALRNLGESVAKRDQAMLERMKTIQLWMAAGLATIAIVALAALLITILA